MSAYEYHITPSLCVLTLRNVVVDGPMIRCDVNHVTSWESIALPNVKRYDSILAAYDEAIDRCECLARSLDRQRSTEIEDMQDAEAESQSRP